MIGWEEHAANGAMKTKNKSLVVRYRHLSVNLERTEAEVAINKKKSLAEETRVLFLWGTRRAGSNTGGGHSARNTVLNRRYLEKGIEGRKRELRRKERERYGPAGATEILCGRKRGQEGPTKKGLQNRGRGLKLMTKIKGRVRTGKKRGE